MELINEFESARVNEGSVFYHNNLGCMYSLESPYSGDSNEYIQYTIILEDRKDTSKPLPLTALINTQRLELPMSRTDFMVPKMLEPLKFGCSYNN